MQDLQFDVLDKPITLNERLEIFRERKHNSLLTNIFIAIGFVALFLYLMLLANALGGSYMAVLFLFAIMGVFGIALVVQWWQAAKTQVQLKRFAAANNLRYGPAIIPEANQGLIFNRGDSRHMNALLQFPDMAIGLYEFGNYAYSEGSGKNRRDYEYGFVHIKLPRRVPHMVLDARVNNNLFGTNLPEAFSKNERMSLEGDFDKYFTLYAPATYQTDALYIFTPDVMQTLIHAVKNYDCEVIDNDLFLYTKAFDFKKRASYEEIVTVAATLSAELAVQTKNYSDAAVGDRALDIVAEPGRRLKTKIKLQTVIAIISMIVYFAFCVYIGFFTHKP